MNPIQQNLINYFLKICIKEEYEFLENKDKTSLIMYHKGQSEENEHWHNCEPIYFINAVVDSCLNSKELSIRLNKIEDNIFEDIWLQCKTKDEKAECLNLFDGFLISNTHQFPKKLSVFSNEEYINILLNKFYTNEKTNSRNDDTLSPIIEFFHHSKMNITPDNLALACKDNKSCLNKLPIKSLLKDFVETYLPDNIEDFRIYWKKIDNELVANQEVVNVYPCVSIGFNKTFIYNLNPSHSIDFYERKLKAINTFINKSKFQKDIPIERSVFDGIQESQSDYRFIIFGDKPEFKLKEFLTDFVTKIISIEDEATPKILNSALAYIKLYQKTEKTYVVKNKIKI